MNFSNRFVNNILGPKGPSMGGVRPRPRKDCSGRDMVKYNYYEYDNLETGKKGIEYAGSKVAVENILNDKFIRHDKNSIVQLTYAQALDRLPPRDRERLRSSTKKKYWNTGVRKDKEE
jgi:hypothetical protein